MTLPNWYEIDIEIESISSTLKEIFKMIIDLQHHKMIDSWFYLYNFDHFTLVIKTTLPAEVTEQIWTYTNIMPRTEYLMPFETDSTKFPDIESFEKFIITFGYLSEMLLKHFKDTGRLSMEIDRRYFIF